MHSGATDSSLLCSKSQPSRRWRCWVAIRVPFYGPAFFPSHTYASASQAFHALGGCETQRALEPDLEITRRAYVLPRTCRCSLGYRPPRYAVQIRLLQRADCHHSVGSQLAGCRGLLAATDRSFQLTSDLSLAGARLPAVSRDTRRFLNVLVCESQVQRRHDQEPSAGTNQAANHFSIVDPVHQRAFFSITGGIGGCIASGREHECNGRGGGSTSSRRGCWQGECKLELRIGQAAPRAGMARAKEGKLNVGHRLTLGCHHRRLFAAFVTTLGPRKTGSGQKAYGHHGQATLHVDVCWRACVRLCGEWCEISKVTVKRGACVANSSTLMNRLAARR